MREAPKSKSNAVWSAELEHPTRPFFRGTHLMRYEDYCARVTWRFLLTCKGMGWDPGWNSEISRGKDTERRLEFGEVFCFLVTGEKVTVWTSPVCFQCARIPNMTIIPDIRHRFLCTTL